MKFRAGDKVKFWSREECLATITSDRDTKDRLGKSRNIKWDEQGIVLDLKDPLVQVRFASGTRSVGEGAISLIDSEYAAAVKILGEEYFA